MIDERLIGALHLSSGTHEDDPGEAHRVFQASTISALLDGAYEGDVTFAELASRGDFGIGTLNGCDGEMVAMPYYNEQGILNRQIAELLIARAIKVSYMTIIHQNCSLSGDHSFIGCQ